MSVSSFGDTHSGVVGDMASPPPHSPATTTSGVAVGATPASGSIGTGTATYYSASSSRLRPLAGAAESWSTRASHPSTSTAAFCSTTTTDGAAAAATAHYVSYSPPRDPVTRNAVSTCVVVAGEGRGAAAEDSNRSRAAAEHADTPGVLLSEQDVAAFLTMKKKDMEDEVTQCKVRAEASEKAVQRLTLQRRRDLETMSELRNQVTLLECAKESEHAMLEDALRQLGEFEGDVRTLAARREREPRQPHSRSQTRASARRMADTLGRRAAVAAATSSPPATSPAFKERELEVKLERVLRQRSDDALRHGVELEQLQEAAQAAAEEAAEWRVRHIEAEMEIDALRDEVAAANASAAAAAEELAQNGRAMALQVHLLRSGGGGGGGGNRAAAATGTSALAESAETEEVGVAAGGGGGGGVARNLDFSLRSLRDTPRAAAPVAAVAGTSMSPERAEYVTPRRHRAVEAQLAVEREVAAAARAEHSRERAAMERKIADVEEQVHGVMVRRIEDLEAQLREAAETETLLAGDREAAAEETRALRSENGMMRVELAAFEATLATLEEERGARDAGCAQLLAEATAAAAQERDEAVAAAEATKREARAGLQARLDASSALESSLQEALHRLDAADADAAQAAEARRHDRHGAAAAQLEKAEAAARSVLEEALEAAHCFGIRTLQAAIAVVAAAPPPPPPPPPQPSPAAAASPSPMQARAAQLSRDLRRSDEAAVVLKERAARQAVAAEELAGCLDLRDAAAAELCAAAAALRSEVGGLHAAAAAAAKETAAREAARERADKAAAKRREEAERLRSEARAMADEKAAAEALGRREAGHRARLQRKVAEVEARAAELEAAVGEKEQQDRVAHGLERTVTELKREVARLQQDRSDRVLPFEQLEAALQEAQAMHEEARGRLATDTEKYEEELQKREEVAEGLLEEAREKDALLCVLKDDMQAVSRTMQDVGKLKLSLSVAESETTRARQERDEAERSLAEALRERRLLEADLSGRGQGAREAGAGQQPSRSSAWVLEELTTLHTQLTAHGKAPTREEVLAHANFLADLVTYCKSQASSAAIVGAGGGARVSGAGAAAAASAAAGASMPAVPGAGSTSGMRLSAAAFMASPSRHPLGLNESPEFV